MSAPTVSVVIPAYNNERFIAQAVDSVLEQEGVDFDLHIADHSSTDHTWKLVQSYADDPRVHLLQTPSGGGAWANWQRVTEQATGRYVKLLCGDDYLLPGVLARQAQLLDADDGAVLTACRRMIVDADGNTLMAARGLQGLSTRMSGGAAVRVAVLRGINPFGEPGAVMFRRSTLVGIGGWLAEHPFLIDQATYSRVLLEGGFVPDLTTGAAFRLSATQWSVGLAREQAIHARSYNAWLHDHHPDVISTPDRLIGDVQVTIAAYGRRLAYVFLKRRMG